MKKIFLRVIPVILVLFCSAVFFLSCSQDDNDIVIPQDELAISDPQIKKEIEFMREKNIITEDLYQQWLTSKRSDILDEWDVLINEKGTIRHDEAYRVKYPLNSHQSKSGMSRIDNTLIDRRIIQDSMKESESSVLSRMKRWKHMYGSSGGTITLRVFTSDGGGRLKVTTAWRLALNNAVAKWNALGLKVKFAVVNATNTNIVGGYVNVYMKNLGDSGIFAQTLTPGTPGYFGEIMEINTSSSPHPDVNGKITVLVHELGHAVGFMHTDEAANGVNIFNTAVTCNEYSDNNSFMYNGSYYNQIFTDFSTCDKQNLQYYWGYGSTLS
ncbi:Dual-action HEIGH metallo-peptidase [candidate division SR1 bacterium Aalborg_AAW-1]|nr:Dual-action HEIGH metallo-peptidase [candidate division SR1 bacterium Aalborg_AAW-1]